MIRKCEKGVKICLDSVDTCCVYPNYQARYFTDWQWRQLPQSPSGIALMPLEIFIMNNFLLEVLFNMEKMPAGTLALSEAKHQA